jgi:hypothetical protein
MFSIGRWTWRNWPSVQREAFMTTHVIAQYRAPAAVFEVIEDSDFYGSSYFIRERTTGRILRGTFTTRRRAVAAAEEEAIRRLEEH